MIYALKTTYKSFCLKVSLMALAALSLVACSQNADSDDTQKNIVSVYFTLSVNEAEASVAAKSRSTAPPEGTGTWQSYDPKGEADDYENAIDVNKLNVYFYKVDGTYAGKVDDMTAYRDDTKKNVYHIVGKMNIDKDNLVNDQFTGRMVVYANMDTPATLPWASTSTDILGQSYSFNPSAPTYIPMWGVRSVSFDASPGTQQNLDDVYMLRAVAKVTVQLDETIMKGWTIEAITMNRWNNKGYCLPSWVDELNDTQDLTFNQSENVYNATDVLQTTPIDFTAATASTASQNLYLPEYDNTSAGVTPATISVKLRKPDGTSEGQTYTLQFVKYDDKDAPTGTPYDIVRNHWYKYTIYKNTERTLSVKLTVRKWNKETHPTIVM